jgi:hypothetical protein
MKTYFWLSLVVLAAAHCGGGVAVEDASGAAAGASSGGGGGGGGDAEECGSFCEGLCHFWECGTGTPLPKCPEGVPCEKVSRCSVLYCAYCSEEGCDEGDTDVTGGACPPDKTCYEQLLCDTSRALCVDDALPQHGCLDYNPGEGPPACWPFQGATCSYQDESGCVETYHCDESGGEGWKLTTPACD